MFFLARYKTLEAGLPYDHSSCSQWVTVTKTYVSRTDITDLEILGYKVMEEGK